MPTYQLRGETVTGIAVNELVLEQNEKAALKAILLKYKVKLKRRYEIFQVGIIDPDQLPDLKPMP